MEPGRNEITRLLRAVQGGDQSAADKLLPFVYSELHRLAKACMRRERPDHTLQTTALIHEAYLRLAGDEIVWQDRNQLVGFAANVMRQVLVDYARAHRAQRRAGDMRRVEMREDLAVAPERLEEVALVDEALSRLAARSPRQARIVELRYFGGLSVDQIAEMLGVSPRSVKRDWSLARIWLFHELSPGAGPSQEAQK